MVAAAPSFNVIEECEMMTSSQTLCNRMYCYQKMIFHEKDKTIKI